MNWTDFITGFTQNPLSTLGKFFETIATNFVAHWWEIMLIILAFAVSRWVVFAFIEAVIPRRLEGELPKWFRNRLTRAWHAKLYKDSLETRGVQRARTIVGLTKSVIDPIMATIAFFTIFAHLGITMTKTTGSFIIGGVSLAIGLGLQGVAKDIIAGITVLTTDAYAVGDYIDTQFGVAGVVKHIGIRLTTLEAASGTMWFVRHSEVAKIGNMTASHGMVTADVTLTWNEEDKHIQVDDLKFAEKLLDETVNSLAVALENVDKVARARAGIEDSEVNDDTGTLQKIATVIPDLVPTMGADTLWDLRAVHVSDLDNPQSLHSNVSTAAKRITGRVPIFTKVETLGLVDSTVNSVSLRLRITLPPKSSRSQAMAVLRRAVFEAFVPHKITPSFSEAPEHELPVKGYLEGE